MRNHANLHTEELLQGLTQTLTHVLMQTSDTSFLWESLSTAVETSTHQNSSALYYAMQSFKFAIIHKMQQTQISLNNLLCQLVIKSRHPTRTRIIADLCAPVLQKSNQEQSNAFFHWCGAFIYAIQQRDTLALIWISNIFFVITNDVQDAVASHQLMTVCSSPSMHLLMIQASQLRPTLDGLALCSADFLFNRIRFFSGATQERSAVSGYVAKTSYGR